MRVLRVGDYYGLRPHNLQQAPKYYVNKNNATDTVHFSGVKVIENLIVPDIENFDINNYKTVNFSKKLANTVQNVDVDIKQGKHNSKIYSVLKNGEEVIHIEKNNNHDNITPGFILGKTGTYATLNVKGGKENYLVIMPAGSKMKTEDGLSVNVKKSVSFTGSTCTVNAFYKPEKTIESINDFLKMTEYPEFSKAIQKNDKDYSEYFHPYILAGGFGSRLEAVSHFRDDNKPSTSTPIPRWNLIDFNLMNLYQANLLKQDTDVDFCVQHEANSAVGCFVTTLGYKIDMTPRGLDLVEDGKSIVPPDKNIIIMPSDNITDVNLSEVLDDYLKHENAGMMVVGVPDYRCYGGLILHNKNNEIEQFITKPSAELLDTGLGRIKYIDKKGREKVLKDGNGMPTSLGNAFIYIINPDILDDITEIYRNKIRNSYKEFIDTHKYPSMTKEDYLDIIESFWDREIIPQLVEKSKNGELKDKNGNELKILTYEALDADWSDVGEYDSYYKTIKNVGRDDCFVNIPKPLKQAVKDHTLDNVLFNVDVKDDFKKLLGNGYVKGKVIIVPENKDF